MGMEPVAYGKKNIEYVGVTFKCVGKNFIATQTRAQMRMKETEKFSLSCSLEPGNTDATVSSR